MAGSSAHVSRRTVLAALAAVPALAVTACGGGSPAPSGGGAPTTVRFALDWTPNTNHTGLYAAQQQGWFTGAGLDVHHDEPLGADNPFLAMDNVVLTPHIAGATVEVMTRHSQLVVDNIRRFCAGEPLVNDLTTGPA